MEFICTKRLLVTIRSSLVVMIIDNAAKPFNYLQLYLQKLQTCLQVQKLFEMSSLLRLELIKTLVRFGLNQAMSHILLKFFKRFSQRRKLFQVIFIFKTKEF
jgi:hypothetical protein